LCNWCYAAINRRCCILLLENDETGATSRSVILGQ
jgi:hypothetical protein